MAIQNNYPWVTIQDYYENTDLTIVGIAKKFGCSHGAIRQRAANGGWQRKGKLRKSDKLKAEWQTRDEHVRRYWLDKDKDSKKDRVTFFEDALIYLTDSNPAHLFFSRFCQERGIYSDHILDWIDDSDLNTLYHRCVEAEKVNLLHHSAGKAADTATAKLWLSSHHDVIEKREIKQTGAIVVETDLGELME